MKKKECIRKYGIAAYKKKLQQGRDWYAKHSEEFRERNRLWRENNQDVVKAGKANWAKSHPEEVKAKSQQQCRKGGKHYEKTRQYKMTGIQHEKELVRGKHNRLWATFKKIIAPESQFHHQWAPGTANYTGVALVEKDQHQHGYIDVIQILEGEITLLTEVEIMTEVKENGI